MLKYIIKFSVPGHSSRLVEELNSQQGSLHLFWRSRWGNNWPGIMFNFVSTGSNLVLSGWLIRSKQSPWVSVITQTTGGGRIMAITLYLQSSGWLMAHFLQHLPRQKEASIWMDWFLLLQGRQSWKTINLKINHPSHSHSHSLKWNNKFLGNLWIQTVLTDSSLPGIIGWGRQTLKSIAFAPSVHSVQATQTLSTRFAAQSTTVTSKWYVKLVPLADTHPICQVSPTGG